MFANNACAMHVYCWLRLAIPNWRSDFLKNSDRPSKKACHLAAMTHNSCAIPSTPINIMLLWLFLFALLLLLALFEWYIHAKKIQWRQSRSLRASRAVRCWRSLREAQLLEESWRSRRSPREVAVTGGVLGPFSWCPREVEEVLVNLGIFVTNGVP